MHPSMAGGGPQSHTSLHSSLNGQHRLDNSDADWSRDGELNMGDISDIYFLSHV